LITTTLTLHYGVGLAVRRTSIIFLGIHCLFLSENFLTFDTLHFGYIWVKLGLFTLPLPVTGSSVKLVMGEGFKGFDTTGH
jgi:hypothetical protein